ncbi:MAG: DUF1801 domain-containing protein [Caldilineaceae bacterium]
MKATQPKFKTIDEYIAGFPPDVQAVLEKIRQTIREAAPEAEETISYQMPAFRQQGNLVYFAAWKKHIGFYPPVAGDEALKNEAAAYAGEKGNLQFPLNEPIPYELIGRIVKQRLQENLAKARTKRKSSYTS